MEIKVVVVHADCMPQCSRQYDELYKLDHETFVSDTRLLIPARARVAPSRLSGIPSVRSVTSQNSI